MCGLSNCKGISFIDSTPLNGLPQKKRNGIKCSRLLLKEALKFTDIVYLRKRVVIESINDILKKAYQIEHSRHNSINNIICNLVASITAYSFLNSKPSIIKGPNIQKF